MDEKDLEIAKLKEEIARLKCGKEEVVSENRQKKAFSKEHLRQLAGTTKVKTETVVEQAEDAPITPELLALQQSQKQASMVHINEENKVSLSSRYFESALKEMEKNGEKKFFDY